VIARPPRAIQAPRPVVGRAGRSSIAGPRLHVARALLAGVVAAALVAGCGFAPPDQASSVPVPTTLPSASPAWPAASEEPALLLLTTVGDAPVLGFVRPSAGITALPVPDPTTLAVTPMGDGSLLALLADGRAFVAPDGPEGLLAGTGWRPLALRWSGALPDGAIVFAAAASPDGARLAAIARPPLAESPSALVIVEPGAGRAAAWALPAESLGTAPAWLDDGRVGLLQRGPTGRTTLAVVTVRSGRVVDRIPFRALDVATSGDAGTAVVLGDESRIFVGPTADILGLRRTPDEGPTVRPGDVVRGGVALDRDGRRLAAVVEDGAGAGQIATFARAGGAWRPAARIAAPPGSRGGWVSWLP
jgi:hypothetical protein